MRTRTVSLLLAAVLAVSLAACGGGDKAPDWQEQYDLGVRYLSEGNYEEAVIAFTAAIEIEPKRAEAYLGLAGAYEALGDTERAIQILTGALDAVEDESGLSSVEDALADAYQDLADTYIAAGDVERGADALREAQKHAADADKAAAIQERLDGLTARPGADTDPQPGTDPGPGTDTPPDTDQGGAGPVVASGTSGDGVLWQLDGDGVLTISGTGPMDDDVEPGASPDGNVRVKKVVIEEGVTYIGAHSFQFREDLTSITIPSSVTRIGYQAFLGCTGLTSLTIPAGVQEIGGNVCDGCSALQRIDVESGSPTYSSVDGALFDAGQTMLIAYPAGKTDTTYSIPASVTRVEESAFSGCEHLTEVTIPNGVTTIGYAAFAGCSGLTSVTIPDGVTALDTWAFGGCSSLTSVSIPASVTSVNYYAFEDCPNLTDIYYGGDEAQWEDACPAGMAVTVHYNSMG